MSNINDKIIEVYTRLTESGVRFYYNDDEVAFGEITELGYLYGENIGFTIEYEAEVKVTVEKFKLYHSKENINLYDWSDIREFDRLLDQNEEDEK
ncbi:MAG: hypothetical protein RR891_04700 [Clostridium sp.]|uniref:hypothetical protein n=1 Tax=Clostridium sp. TaxID=1506 RepID=UPI00306C959F